MNYKTLEDMGASVVSPLVYSAMRPKVRGFMFAGSAELKLGKVAYHLEMWWHGPEPEDMTEELAKEHTTVKGIIIDEKYYDKYWYTLEKDNEIWLHKVGWFHDRILRHIVEGDGPFEPTDETCLKDTFDRERMKKLGFERIL